MPLLSLSAWIIATFCSSLSFAIKLSSNSDIDGIVLVCANILVALVIGLLTLHAYRVHPQKARQTWLRFAYISAALFLMTFVSFVVLRSTWTCQYTTDIRLVTGPTPTLDLSNYLSTFEPANQPSCSELLADYGGATDRMYAQTELTLRFITLVFSFFAMWCSLACAVVSIAYGLGANRTPSPKRNRGVS
jgi:nitrate reductase NapE component